MLLTQRITSKSAGHIVSKLIKMEEVNLPHNLPFFEGDGAFLRSSRFSASPHGP